MRIRHFIHSPEELLKQGKEIVKQSADAKFIHRVSMVNLILGGMKTKDLSQYCGDSVRTINLWVKKVDEEGWDSLMTVKLKGRPAAFSDTQLDEIKQALSNDPETYGYHVWDGPTLSEYIKTTYNMEYGVRACQKLWCKSANGLAQNAIEYTVAVGAEKEDFYIETSTFCGPFTRVLTSADPHLD